MVRVIQDYCLNSVYLPKKMKRSRSNDNHIVRFQLLVPIATIWSRYPQWKDASLGDLAVICPHGRHPCLIVFILILRKKY